uniref:WW domain-containing protein n=2 Tax=Davidia involucrata TaxID=16924 RepID=A0A5B6YZF6_DAVIN
MAGEDMEINADEDIDAHKVEQHDLESASAYLEALQTLVDNDAREIDPTGSSDLIKEMDSMGQTSVPGLSDVQVIGDASSGWKIVFHEESNRYYYWNTVTGETSWEVPDVLAQGTELTCERKSAPDAEGRESAVVDIHESGSTLDTELDDSIATKTVDGSEAANVISETRETYEHGPQMEVWNEANKDEISEDKKGGSDINETDANNSSGIINALCHETSSLGDYISPEQSGDALLENGRATGSYSEKYTHNGTAHDEHETGTDLSSRLVKHGECLLERLSSLKGSKGHLQGDEQISKYILEVEIRLSDIKSLLSYGSSLFPFWVHSERQLKQLESKINDELSQFYKSARMSEVEETHNSQESMGVDIKADGYEKKVVCSTPENTHTSVGVDVITEVQKDSHNEASGNYAVNTEHLFSIGYTTTHSESGGGGKGEVHGVASAAEITPNTVLHSEEDVDMDVDMEVEDAIPASNTTMALDAKYCAPPEQPIQSNLPAEHESFVLEEGFGVPPPPDEDWIPPPPPDNELVPPPPPDEPPEPSYPSPPPYLETVQPLSYTEQYNLSYVGHNFEYYGQTHTEVPGNNFYGHAEGCHVAVPHPPLYYEVVPNTYPGADPVVVNPVEPVAYYDLQDGTVAPVPVISGVESSGFHSESGNETLGSGIRSVEALAEASCGSLPNTKLDVSAVIEETEKASIEFPFAPATIQVPATSSIIESVPVSSTAVITAAAIAATSTVAKVQSKVSRSKKRTVAAVSTLRSNKKVSSLVDKWKAAKEELHEDEEDEPENAYEILEKKRQREIEEWRAQQIASGEAQDNANFQPLGGDWRKRVKRRRAQAASEAVQTPSDGLTDGSQQPDLNKLSRDLPSGWQAYWDEASKQVYYGNSVSSETTWIRPTN